MAREVEPLIGKSFGKWTVLAESPSKPGVRKVLCRCECGTEKPVWTGSLKNGGSMACASCSQSEARFTTMLGRKFGKLTVVEEHQNCNNRKVMARCDCGTIVERFLSAIRRSTTVSCGCVRRSKQTHGCVYFLLNPVSKEIRYVGSTATKPSLRLNCHVSSGGRGGKDKTRWIESLKPNRPEFFIAEDQIPLNQLSTRERQHIDCLTHNGHDLLNVH